MRLLTAGRGEQLPRIPPQTIKRGLGGADIAADSWKVVRRVLTQRKDNHIIVL